MRILVNDRPAILAHFLMRMMPKTYVIIVIVIVIVL